MVFANLGEALFIAEHSKVKLVTNVTLAYAIIKGGSKLVPTFTGMLVLGANTAGRAQIAL